VIARSSPDPTRHAGRASAKNFPVSSRKACCLNPEDQQYLAFADLYDGWQCPDGGDLYTFTIITTDADESMARLHNRMAVILARALEDAWLDPEFTKAHDVLDMLSRSTGLELDAYPVSRMVNKPSVDSEALIQRVE
jgi:putative SOS response-associated peptidase YedK